MARPRKNIDIEYFKKLCEIQCTLEEIAGFFDCSPDTIENWCKRELHKGFSEIYKKFSAPGKISLRRTQFKLAEKNVSMAIFLGKNYLGQTDKVEQIITEVEDLKPLAEMLSYEGSSDDKLETVLD